MADELPRTIENRIAGERVTFLATAGETGGEYVRARNEVSAGAQGPPMHHHLAYTEAFEVVEGTLDVCVGSEENHRQRGRRLPHRGQAREPWPRRRRCWRSYCCSGYAGAAVE